MNEERWLVKSSGRILGPFSADELTLHLRARTLSIIDEIRDPSTRWTFIRENPMMREVVRQLRDEDQTHPEATQTTFVGGTSGGRTVTLSVTESIHQEGEITPNPTQTGYTNRSTDPRPINATERTIRSGLGNNTYGSMNDTRVQEKLANRKALIRNLFIGLVLCCAGFAVGLFYYQRHLKELASDQARQWVSIAREQVRFGQMTTALEFMEKASRIVSLSVEDRILYSELTVQAGGNAADALRILGETQSVTEPRLVREMSLAKALVFMKQMRWNEASIELNALLSFNPNDEEALHNQALLEYFRGNPMLSMQTAVGLMEKGYQSGQLYVLRGLLALSWPEKAGQALKIQQASDELRRNLESDYELHFEKSLVLMNLRLNAGHPEEASQILRTMWGADPFDSRNFLQSLSVDQQLLGWERFTSLCDRVVNAFPDEESSRALRAVCLFQKGENSSALQMIDETRRQLSQSGLLAAVHADLLLNVGRIGEAKTLLQVAQADVLGQLVMGQICQIEKDWGCAEGAWKRVLSVQPKNPMALFGEAFVTKQRGNDIFAREQVRKAILLSPRYRPFLESRGDSNVY